MQGDRLSVHDPEHIQQIAGVEPCIQGLSLVPRRVTNPDLPNYALNIPAGATLFGWDGTPIERVSVRAVPVDRLQIRPLPDEVTMRGIAVGAKVPG